MTKKYERPTGAYSGDAELNYRTKYQDDAGAQPRIAISSTKIDGDFNYVIDAINEINEASGSRGSIDDRLNVTMNADGTLKTSVVASIDEWIAHTVSNMTRVDNSTITMDGDQTGIYQENRRVRLIVGGEALFANVLSANHSGDVTTLELIDIYDGSENVAVISEAPTALFYSPFSVGKTGNAQTRFGDDASPSGHKIRGDAPVYRLSDVGDTPKEYGIRVDEGELAFVENTGTEASPVWQARAGVNGSGLILPDANIVTNHLADSNVTTAKVADAAVTAAKLADGSVGTTKLANDAITLDKIAHGTPEHVLGFDNSGAPAYVPAEGGKVLQMVWDISTGGDFYSADTNYVDVPSMNITVTPTKSNSILMVMAYFGMQVVNGTIPSRGALKLVRDGGPTILFNERAHYLTTTSNYIAGIPQVAFGLDAPATTSPVTYKVQVAPIYGNQHVQVVTALEATRLMVVYEISGD